MNQGRYSGAYTSTNNYIGRSQVTLNSIFVISDISKQGWIQKAFFPEVGSFYVRGARAEGVFREISNKHVDMC